jgi:hypothetical protein
MGTFSNNRNIKKIFSTLLYGLYLGLFVLFSLEIMYRFQVMDFYAVEGKGCNPHFSAEKKNNILVFGDSFTGHPDSYLKYLQDSLPQYQCINQGVPGTGIYEANLIASKRNQNVPPKMLIYQIYVGNDLMNIRKNTHWGHLPFWKNVYYSLANYLKSLEFLNYRLAQFQYVRQAKAQVGIPAAPFDSSKVDTFDVTKYSAYEKQVLGAEPELLANSILLQNDRKADMQTLIQGIQTLIGNCAITDSIPVYLLVIPHCSQVNDFYRNKYTQLGISLSKDSLYSADNYPFIKELSAAFSSQKNVHIVNPLPMLREEDKATRRMYNENDFHFTDAGYEVTARAIR